jgi:hypothetical protein
VDCGSASFGVPVSDALFGPEREVALSDQPAPLFRPDDRPGSDQRCGLIAIDSGSGFVVGRTNPGYQSYVVNRDANGKIELTGPTLLASAKSSTAVCRAQTPLTWSETTVTGISVVQAIDAPDPAGCQKLRLGPATGGEGSSVSWSVCMGKAKLPFAVGEHLRISENDNRTANARVFHAERTDGERVELWLLRGAPGGFAATGWDSKLLAVGNALRPVDCRPELRKGCSTIEVGDGVALTYGARSLILESGESASLLAPDGLELDVFVVHDVLRVVIDPGCSKDLAAAPADVGVAVIVHGGPRGPASQIAAPAGP